MNYYKESYRKYYPIILGLFLMGLHFLSAYPGGMSSDSFDQYSQSVSGNYSSHHPPLMAMTWSLLHYIYQGPQTMLMLNLVFLWGGILLLFYADSQNKYRYLYFLIAFLPSILSQSATIWKDVVFALGTFFCCSACIFFTYRQKPTPSWVIVALLLIVFYIVGVKFQAQFIAPILVFFILSVYLKTSRLVKLIATSFISIIIIYANSMIIDRFCVNGHSEQMRQFFDVAGVSVEINNDDLLPDYVKNDHNLYSFEKLKAHYTARWVDPWIYDNNTKVYVTTSDPMNLQDMSSAYKQLVTRYPLKFLKHRIKNFGFLMINGDFYHYSFMAWQEAQKHGIDIRNNYLKDGIIKYLKLYPKVLTINLINFILILLYLVAIATRQYVSNLEKNILAYIVIISIVFSITLFFTTMASDYRYYYVVRVLTLFSLPIYLKFLTQSKTMKLTT